MEPTSLTKVNLAVPRGASRWYVAQTNPTLEARALASLSRAGYGTYCPTWKREKFNARKAEWVIRERVLLPGYVFVEMPHGLLDFYSLRDCDGVKGVLGVRNQRNENQPFPIPSRTVEALMAAQLALRFDDTREAKAKLGEQAISLYSPGMRIMVSKGPFADFPAEVEAVRANGTIVSLIQIFGRMTPVDLAPDQVELVAA